MSKSTSPEFCVKNTHRNVN